MSRYWRIEASLTDKLSYYHILLMMVCLPVDRFYGEVVFVSFCIHTAITFKRSQLAGLKDFKPLLAVQALFWVTAVSIIYSFMPKRGLESDLSEQVPLLLIPVLFALHRELIIKYQQRFLNAFSAACVAVSICLFGVVLRTVCYFHLPLQAVISQSFTNHNFSAPVNMHATFLSAMLGPAAINLLSKLEAEHRRKRQVLLVSATLILFAALIQLSSKTALLSLLILFVIYLLKKPFTRKKAWLAIGTTTRILLAALLVTHSATLKDHLVTDLKRDLDMKVKRDVTDSRLDRWKLIVVEIAKKPLLGYGAGTERAILQEQYFDHKLYNSYLNRLNAHNQYLSLWLQSGLWGLMVFLVTLCYGFRVAFKNTDWVMLSFLLAIAITSAGEDMLLYNKNIFLFSILYSLFLITRTTQVRNRINTHKLALQATLTPF